jgi:hypothetical protein
VVGDEFGPAAVTMRPEIGWKHAVQFTVGPDIRGPFNHGSRLDFSGTGAVVACTGKGRRAG